MKLTPTILIPIFLILTTLTTLANTNTIKISWLKKNFGTLSYEEMLQITKSPQDICYEVKVRVKYKKDLIDIKKEPKQTWEDKYGDCEDFSNLIQSICKIKNIQTEIYVFYEKNNPIAHSVVIGNNWMANNGKYQPIEPIESLNDASRKIARSLNWNKTVNYKKWNEWEKQSLYYIASK